MAICAALVATFKPLAWPSLSAMTRLVVAVVCCRNERSGFATLINAWLGVAARVACFLAKDKRWILSRLSILR